MHIAVLKHRPRLLPSGSEATPHENHLYIHVGLPIDEGAVVHLFFFYLPQVALDKLYHFATSHVFESEVAGRMCSDMCGAAAKVRTCLIPVCVCCVCLKPMQPVHTLTYPSLHGIQTNCVYQGNEWIVCRGQFVGICPQSCRFKGCIPIMPWTPAGDMCQLAILFLYCFHDNVLYIM